MRHSERIERWVMYTAAVLLCLVLASFWLMSNIYARYTAFGTGGDEARVAAFVFDLKEDANQSFDLSSIQKPGDEVKYTFSVTNQNQSRISEVAEQYTIELEAEGSIPIECEVTQSSVDGNTSVCKADNISSDQNNSISSAVEIDASKAYTQEYTLSVKWPEKYNDAKYAENGGNAAVTLTVHAEQID